VASAARPRTGSRSTSNPRSTPVVVIPRLMNIAALLIVLRLVFSRTAWVAIANNVFSLFIFPVDGFGWAGVVVLLVLSDALSRR
jgi:lysyl-tRNA synthetase, class II